MADCIFCKIVAGEIPSVKVWEDEKFYAFLDINPVNPGHTLLIPKEHVDYLFDVEDPLYSELFQAAKGLSKPLQKAMMSQRVGVVVEGLLVPHVHVHLIPISAPGELDASRSAKAEPDKLKETADRIRSEIKE
jgi:histidine triad (HIT) family protein